MLTTLSILGRRLGVAVLSLIVTLLAVAPLAAPAASMQDITQSVVVIEEHNNIGQGSMGAGVIIAEHNGVVRIVTAAHVLAWTGLYTVRFFGGEVVDLKPSAFTTLRGGHDLAVGDVPNVHGQYPVASLADTSSAVQKATVIGHPLGHEWTATSVTRLGYLDESGPAYTLGNVNHGDSGGGVFNERGELVGILTSMATVDLADGSATNVRSGITEDVAYVWMLLARLRPLTEVVAAH